MRDRFSDRVAEIGQDKAAGSARGRNLVRMRIYSAISLREYCKSVVDLVIAKECRDGELWKNFWKGKGDRLLPVDEPFAQPVIYSMLRHWFDVHGITFVRKVKAGGGALDFFASRTIEGNAISCAIEVKLAHSKKLEHGLNAQLQTYMNDLGAKYGIFLVFWFKGDGFSEPSKFEDIDSMKTKLESIKAGGNIQIQVIDCPNPGFKPSSSRRTASA